MIQNLVFPVDLTEMPFNDFNVLVGMEWIYKNHAIITCRSKNVPFKDPTCSHIIVQGQRSFTSYIISAALSRMFVRQGCSAYFTHIVNTQLESPCIKAILIVFDFPEVFPQIIKDHLMISSDRKKSYADLKRSEIEYQVGYKVLLKVS